jgi:2,3-bisphosphoglycerate-independent phosphoglycerate mutase
MVVLCILDGVGWGRRDDTDAVASARMPHFDALRAQNPWRLLRAHGRAVGLPSDADMGNSEVGHNAMGAGRVIDQGATLVDRAIQTGEIFQSAAWKELVACPTLHLVGLVSDGNVHSHVDHLLALVRRAHADGVGRIRVHGLTDGRDVSARSALRWVEPLEAELATLPDACVASGGGRMQITMDRYEADWAMVERGWRCHVRGEGRGFASATEAIQTFYAESETVDDQWLPAFVVHRNGRPAGPIESGHAVCLFNFRGDRAIELSRAFEEGPSFAGFDRGPVPRVVYAGMMQYDGDLKLPRRFLVSPPTIDRTVAQAMAAAGLRSYALSETQKFGHVTYFWNGNRSGKVSEELEEYAEVESDRVPFDQAPRMKALEITDLAVDAIRSGTHNHVRLNLANGDMVGHTGNFAATVEAMECVDACLGRLVEACRQQNAILLVTADHGNADEMFELDRKGSPILVNGRRKPRTSHSLNPVPFVLVDPAGEWRLSDLPDAGIASIGGTLLHLLGVPPPADYLPSLVTRAG